MDRAGIQAVLDAAVASGAAAGVAAGVVDARGTLMEVCTGVIAAGSGQAMGAETQFWIASMTKPVTSVAAMQLVEKGLLELDAPIGVLLPELRKPLIVEGGKFRRARREITLRHLLTHTAGFGYVFGSAEYAALLEKNPEPPAWGTRKALQAPLLFEPGARWEYGLSTDWVGLAVEAASGMALDAYFAKHIFAPLGMRDCGFFPEAERQAGLHYRQADGSLCARPPALPERKEVLSGGQGLYATLGDYLKFLRVFLRGGAGVLRPESVAEMARNQIGGLEAGVVASRDPALFLGTGIEAGMGCGFGLGFLIYRKDGPDGRRQGSFGWLGVANTHFWVDPAVNLAAVIMMQTLPAGDAGALATRRAFERAVYDAAQ